MAKSGYNPVSRPNPAVDAVRTGVMSQGHDGNVRPDVTMDEAGNNVRWSDGPTYGEDQC